MSESKTLKAKLAAATEVTSLASTDKLAVIGSDGEPKKISQRNIKCAFSDYPDTIPSVGWIRVAKLASTTNTTLIFLGKVTIASYWGSVTPSILSIDLFCASASWSISTRGCENAKVYNSTLSDSTYTKCRIVAEKSGGTITQYLEIYTESTNDYHRKLSSYVEATIGNPALIDISQGVIPSSGKAVEFDLTTVGGG